MINKGNFKDLLTALNFIEENNVFTKNFTQDNLSLRVDFQKELLIYPENLGLKINERQTCNFSSNENFVVFECVNRLLEKGYKPNHIELEPKWKLGHGASGGRADILIRDNIGNTLLIIECKTEGREYNEAWKATLTSPTQLFTYAQQDRSTKFLCLYSSDCIDGEVIYKNQIITLIDNEGLLEKFLDKEPLAYRTATVVEDIYKVWKETYLLDSATKGIFENEIQPYHIGKLKFTVDDLNNVSDKDIQGKYHEFASILRQHNVSGRENAFDKLVNLILCKVVDEKENADNLQFYWKGVAYDNYFDLIDRLQRLYKIGMDKFLKEEVTYVDEKSIDEAFRYFKNDRDATKDTIKSFFRQLKFFTNSDFAFVDVHNENLFYQNSEVLLKIVKMLQDIKLNSDKQNQFLGDMFEGFLDQGIKQSEGQFFTPMPIVKFILNSLPLEEIIAKNEIPKVIDYACGAGHFLNEYASQIKPLVVNNKKVNISEYYPEVIGVEKEYRLSKVSKVSSFMYGQDDINIIYADALAENKEIKDGDFSILVANPPYSVKGFLETLKPSERRKFELLNSIEAKSYPNNNSIETFFVERAKQLLKTNGVAAIILPAPLISKGAQTKAKKKNIYVATRELLLKYFDIVAIVEFGKGTFGKTGTNTVTLFLRRKEQNPSLAEQYEIRTNAWFNNDMTKDGIFEDEHLIKLYCDQNEINFTNYKSLLAGQLTDDLLAEVAFKDYRRTFDKTTEIVNKKKSQTFKAMDSIRQKVELDALFLDYTRKAEKQKLYFFVLANQNPQDVLIIKAPSDNAAEKKFLGYDWSTAKGKEGIKYLGKARITIEKDDDDSAILEDEDKRVLSNILNLTSIQTPLYDPKNRNNPSKLNYLIQRNFMRLPLEIPEELREFVSTSKLEDMIDFRKKDFNLAISLSPKRTIRIDTKWELVTIDDYIDVKIGGTPSREVSEYFEGDQLWVSISEMKGGIISDTKEKLSELGVKNSNVKLIPKGTTLISFKLSIGKTAISGQDLYTNEAIAALIPRDKKEFLDEYLFYLFDAKLVDLEKDGLNSFGQSLNSDFIKNSVKIPKPPIEEQKKIIADCKKLDKLIEKQNKSILSAENDIRNLVNQLFTQGKIHKLDDELLWINKKTYNPTINSPYEEFIYVDIDSIGKGNGIINYTQRILGIDAPSRARRIANKGNVVISTVRPYLRGFAYISSDVSNCIFSTGFAILEVKDCQKLETKALYYAFMYSDSLMSQMEAKMPKASYPSINATDIEEFTLQFPDTAVQKQYITKIEGLEAAINASKTKILDLNIEKHLAVKKYL
ncbi:N-6 DNA methylase [Chryseobacterium kwangjuense]|uniref:N-6 DNA methylase n=1 Tax=Chryseobacterium kwangjuense TaxID=267125 RepID=A0ABW9K4A9_9FLAO